jgi:Ca2+:H+ antiporter
LGSILAAIGLTIPAVALVSIVLGQPLELGLDDKDQVLLVLTLTQQERAYTSPIWYTPG